MTIKVIVAVAIVGAAVSGCATIIKGPSQNIAINTTPVDGAECTLHNSEGTWRLTTPGKVRVDKTKNDITLTCQKAGYRDSTDTLASGFETWTVGNVLIGGLIGLGIDAATGSINEYPYNYTVQMRPVEHASTSPVNTPLSTPAVLPPPVQPIALGAPSS